jgi:DNA-directed RNA polymerase subunit RPC12/RpoP
VFMPKWVLKCDNCNGEFTHSMITDMGAESYFLPQKPDLGEDAELECPHCGNKDTYDRSDLLYRA